jgi:hypothetical protein
VFGGREIKSLTLKLVLYAFKASIIGGCIILWVYTSMIDNLQH